jgi:hypothetical protein
LAVEANRSDAVRVGVAADVVEISWDERDRLVRKLSIVTGFEAIVDKFEAAAPDAPVVLDLGDRLRLRAALEAWANGSQLPHGIARLLAALVQAGPSRKGG